MQLQRASQLIMLWAAVIIALASSHVMAADPPSTCPTLAAPRHGAVSFSAANNTRPALATFTCALGREIVGARTSKCLRAGKWSHATPKCVSVGLRAYPNRAGLSTLGVLKATDEDVLLGLIEAAQKSTKAAGFTIRTTNGVTKAWLLKEHKSLSNLTASADCTTYLFTDHGSLKKNVGFRASKLATLRGIEFATDASVLRGLKNVVAARQVKNNAIIGFTISRGRIFRASLLGWEGLPLRESKTKHAYVLRPEVEDAIKELGCFHASPKGKPALRTRTPLPLSVTIKSARLVCAGIARSKSHRYFAISERDCQSGNNFYGRYGAADPIQDAEESIASCAISTTRAAALNISREDAAVVIGAGAAKGFSHTFSLEKTLLIVPDMFNGGFEEDNVLTPEYPNSEEDEGKGKQSIVIGKGGLAQLRDWTVSTEQGEVGLATYGSEQLTNQTVPEGKNVLYIENDGIVTQELIGLEKGLRYTLRFSETFRRDQAPGMTLKIQLGETQVLYQNDYVSIPLWTKRRITFRAPADSFNISFIASSQSVAHTTASTARPDAALLLDAISLSRKGFAAVRSGFVGAKNHGRVGVIDSTNSELQEALLKITRDQQKKERGILGYRLQNGVPTGLSNEDLVSLKPSAGSTVFLNNGTVLANTTTNTQSGLVSIKHPWFLKAVARVAQRVANSVAFSVNQDARKGIQVIVLASAAMPLEQHDDFITYFFDSHIKSLGCWARPASGSNVLKTLHTIRSGPVSRRLCAEAASAAEHTYFALQDGGNCVSGNNDVSDPSDDLYYTGGRSAGCDTRCANGRDNCGGKGAANVFRLPPFARVSVHGSISTYPLQLSTAQRGAAQDVFDSPGQFYFNSVSPADQEKLASIKKARDAAAAEGFDVNTDSLTNSTKLEWAHSLQYIFSGAEKYAVTKYIIQAPALAENHPATPSAWTFEGSSDGLNWVQLDRQRHIAFYTGQKRTFLLRNTRAFHFHRIVVTENGGLGVPGFGIEGLQFFARRERVRFLQALYRFESAGNAGWDSSFSDSDLQILGGVINGTDANLLSEFNVTRAAKEVKIGKGALKIRNSAGSLPSYLAVDDKLKAPSTLPIGSESFSISFWFFVDSQIDNEKRFAGSSAELRPSQFTILSWGNSDADAASNTISLDRDFQSIKNSFGSGEAKGLVTPQGDLQDKWHHYAVSFDAVTGRHKVWLDTKLVASRVYNNPSFSVTAEKFVIGAKQLPSVTGRPGSDEFNGLIDDLAIFNGPLTDDAVKEISGGQFKSYLPPGCQDMSDSYQIESGMTWGYAPTAVKERFLRNNCYTKPTSCQTLSDQYGISPKKDGKAGYYARTQYKRMQCATWPSVLIKANTVAACPKGKFRVLQGVFTAEAAFRECNNAGKKCQAYVWGGKKGSAANNLKPYELRLCKTYLSDLQYAKHVTIVTKVSKYLLHADAKVQCDAHTLPTHNFVPSSIHARWLCDSTPGCVAYVWSGKKGEHSKGRAPTPGRLILCASTKRTPVFFYPDSGYEVGEKLRNYVVMSDRYAPCSAVGTLAVVQNVTSSLHARRECDRLDGTTGVPQCSSYAWNRQKSELSLCSGVPQTAIQYIDGIESGVIAPEKCQQISDDWAVTYGESWGNAPFDIRQTYHFKNCTTTPSTCQQLSDKYKLQPNVSKKVAAAVPGTIRDLWLRQKCLTRPQVTESQWFIEATYDDLQTQINRLNAKIDSLNAKVTAAEQNPAVTAEERKVLVDDLAKAKAVVQKQLDDLHNKQVAELGPILQRAAKSSPTLEQSTIIHDIATGLINASKKF